MAASRKHSLAFFSTVFLFLLLFSPYLVTTISRAQSDQSILPGAPPFIDLGFGPNSLSPATQGSPIFTANDSLWVYSTLNQPLTADLVNPANVTHTVTLSPSQIVSVYQFTDSDVPGEWTLYFTLPNSTYYALPIFLVIPSQNQAPVSLSEYSIQNGQINLGFSVDSQDAYDEQGCLTSSNVNGSFALTEPGSIGPGEMQISLYPSNSTAQVTDAGQVSTPFSFWFELDYSYSYATSLVNASISRNIQVARSAAILFNSSLSQTVSFPVLSNLRSGRYQLRGYFDSGSGFAVEETSLLYMGRGNWFWLSACNPFSVAGTSFSKQVNLSQNPSSWPSTLYFMYQYEGIEQFYIVPLQINLARLDFVGQPGNVELSDFTYSIANNSDVEASGAYSGSIYVIAKSYPITLSVTPMIGAESLSPVSVLVSAPFTDTQTSIEIGKLTVAVLNNSKAAGGALVDVSNSEGASLSSTVSSGGNTSFDLPAGFYNITIVKNSATESGNATVYDGDNTIVTFSFNSGIVPRSYFEYLLVPLVIGLALNVWAWVIGPKREKYPRLQ